MKMPFMEKENPVNDNRDNPDIENGKDKKNIAYYTGEKSKDLIVHIMQKGIEVDKPMKTKIYAQDIKWRMRQYPIVPDRFIYDYKGIAHQYVDVNDVAILTWHKDHTDTCKKCGGKMTVDAKESRALGRRGVFHAIWGLDNTHMMLLIVFALMAMAMTGAFFWAYMNDTKNATQLEGANKEIARLNSIISPPPPTDTGAR